MAQKLSDIAVAARLEESFARIGAHLKDWRKRESFAMYASGILGDGERKSDARNQREGLSRFLHDGRLPLDNNISERELRRQAVKEELAVPWQR